MKWTLVVRDQVWNEVEEVASWFGQENRELKTRFVKTVSQAVDKLVENPYLASKRSEKIDVRWVRPSHFPYRIIYRVYRETKTIVVLMLLHSARSDQRWKKHVKGD